MGSWRGPVSAVAQLLRGSMSLSQFWGRVMRKLQPRAAVRRHVQGVELVLPREHRLPDYAADYPAYGQNLVELAVGLAEDGEFTMVDVGANIGDSAVQVLKAVPRARVVCVEGDPEWLPWLDRNVGREERVQVVPALLVVDPQGAAPLTAVRHRGTTRFVEDGAGQVVTQIAIDDLPQQHLDLSPVRLVKSDTDGHDTRLVPALALAYAADCPVIFFEYDEGLSAGAGDSSPEQVVEALSAAGYETFAAWDNLGAPVMRFAAQDWTQARAQMTAGVEAGNYHFWDIAAVHGQDRRGRELVERLVP